MNTDGIIILLSVLILVAYLFELTYKVIRIPSIMVLILSGIIIQWLVRNYLHLKNIPDVQYLLKIFGTVGLVLIVFEGTLELKISKNNLLSIGKIFLFSVFEVVLIMLLCAGYIALHKKFDWHTALLNVIPFSIISSAIAIPTASVLSSSKKQFIIYESSFSDIVGILIFNFFFINESINGLAIFNFSWQMVLLIIISIVASIILAMILSRMKHKIKFIPIITMMLFLYSLLHFYHLPSLLFILIFGLALSNFDWIKNLHQLDFLKLKGLEKEVQQLDEIIAELTFGIKSIFFLLFGFSLNIQNLWNLQDISWALLIVGLALIVRYVLLYLFRFSFDEILFIFPRGLITVLLFYLIPENKRLVYFNDTVLTHIIFISLILLIFNNLIYRTKIELSEI